MTVREAAEIILVKRIVEGVPNIEHVTVDEVITRYYRWQANRRMAASWQKEFVLQMEDLMKNGRL